MSDFRETILDLAVEDGYGLWEVLWRITTTRPDISAATAIEAATKTIAEMYEKGLLVLERRNAGISTPVSKEEVAAVLHILPQTDHAFDLIFPKISPSAHNAFYDMERFMALLV